MDHESDLDAALRLANELEELHPEAEHSIDYDRDNREWVYRARSALGAPKDFVPVLVNEDLTFLTMAIYEMWGD